MKTFNVTLEIEAPNKEAVERMLDGMPHADRIFSEKIVDDDEPFLRACISYVEDWNGRGEHYVFDGGWSDKPLGLYSAFPLIDYKGEKGALVHYTALTKIRELLDLGYDIYFE